MDSIAEPLDDESSIRCATANIVAEREYGPDGETRTGTKHFSGGAKVYIIDAHCGTCDSAIVVGHHRKSGRYIKITMKAKHLENFRMTSVYSPKVLDLLQKHYAVFGSKAYLNHKAEHFCLAVAEWAELERENKSE